MGKVNGKKIGSCLGDELSIRWMEDADVANFNRETVQQQVTKVTSEVKKSHVQQFGDSSIIGGEVIGNFEGADAAIASKALNSSWIFSEDDLDSAVNSRDVEVHLAYFSMERAETLGQRRQAQQALSALLTRRMQ